MTDCGTESIDITDDSIFLYLVFISHTTQLFKLIKNLIDDI